MNSLVKTPLSTRVFSHINFIAISRLSSNKLVYDLGYITVHLCLKTTFSDLVSYKKAENSY